MSESFSLEAGIVAECVELDFEGDKTRVTFEVPHGAAFTAGNYLICPLVETKARESEEV